METIDDTTLNMIGEMQKRFKPNNYGLKNLDVGTEDERCNRFREFCDRHDDCIGCPFEDIPNRKKRCTLLWSQMPYKESEANNG